MGAAFATDLASMDGLSIQEQIAIHLSSNFYPPIPVSMAASCIDAIQAYWEDDLSRLIILPDGVSWRGESTAPAYAMINQHRLHPWTEDNTDDSDIYTDPA